MIQNLLAKLPSLRKKSDDEPSPEELELQAKKERIQFHRDHVRNGPANFRHVTSGMQRRAQERDLRRQMKKARRSQVRNYFQTQQLAATVRGQLQLAGLIPFVVPRELDLMQQAKSAAWLVQHFSDGPTSFAYDDVVKALSAALKFYGEAVGLPGLRIPEDYVVPVYELGTEPQAV
jgi:hypothetical protein